MGWIGSIFGLVTGAFGRYALLAQVIFWFLGAAAITAAYFYWESQVGARYVEKYRAIQVAEILKAKDKEIEAYKEQVLILSQAWAEKEEKLEEQAEKLRELERQIDTNTEDREASPVIKDTIEGIRKLRKSRTR